MKVEKLTREKIRDNLYLFKVVVTNGNRTENFEITRFGRISDEQMRKHLETCKSFFDIIYLDDKRYWDLNIYQQYKERFSSENYK